MKPSWPCCILFSQLHCIRLLQCTSLQGQNRKEQCNACHKQSQWAFKQAKDLVVGIVSRESWIIIQSCLNAHPNHLWRWIRSMHIEFTLDAHRNNLHRNNPHSCEHYRFRSNAHQDTHVKVPREAHVIFTHHRANLACWQKLKWWHPSFLCH